NKPLRNRGTGRTHAKSGCRTCKIRKIKCDEGRPACRRCVSTGRVCDGYGVWGGGGDFYAHGRRSLISKDTCLPTWEPANVPITAGNADEKFYFDWFRFRTVKKIPGAFVLTFWETLIFQATMSEPAVLHAVLTLSSVHKRDIVSSDDERRSIGSPDEQEQFTLQHYTNAIRHLRPHFSTRDLASVRVALISCFIFVCLEFLRGHFRTAQGHLESGLNVLRELQFSSCAEGIFAWKPSRNSIDDCIITAFSRLHTQVELFKHSYQHPFEALQLSQAELAVSTFHSVNQAWQQIERLLNKIFHLTEQVRRQHISNNASPDGRSALLGHQQQIQAELAQWLGAFEESGDMLQSQDPEWIRSGLLRVHHTMASIMADVCLSQDDESIFDSHTGQFVLLINQSVDMWKVGSSRALPGHWMDMSRSLVDIGWISPLYYTALRCRIHRVRLQAIRLLETASHREGIWDSKIASCVARQVMKIEERDCYEDLAKADDFPLSSSPSPQDLSLPILPQFHRVHEVKVALSDGPTDSVILSYRQTAAGWKDVRVAVR
ncbi:hypothetical protein NA57DRAFT_10668, partial [Rhizodiscina lignyota]